LNLPTGTPAPEGPAAAPNSSANTPAKAQDGTNALRQREQAVDIGTREHVVVGEGCAL
jgi:hypothetical protein